MENGGSGRLGRCAVSAASQGAAALATVASVGRRCGGPRLPDGPAGPATVGVQPLANGVMDPRAVRFDVTLAHALCPDA